MYCYQLERPKIFTEDGQRAFLKARDAAHKLLQEAGAFKMFNPLKGLTGDTWFMMALVDRMVELGEIREVTPKDEVCGQDRVFVAV
jgi:hypothetical protein